MNQWGYSLVELHSCCLVFSESLMCVWAGNMKPVQECHTTTEVITESKCWPWVVSITGSEFMNIITVPLWFIYRLLALSDDGDIYWLYNIVCWCIFQPQHRATIVLVSFLRGQTLHHYTITSLCAAGITHQDSERLFLWRSDLASFLLLKMYH